MHRVSGTSSAQTLTVYDAAVGGYPGTPFGTTLVPSFSFQSDASSTSSTLASTLNAWTTSQQSGHAIKFVGTETPGTYTYKSIDATLDITYDYPPDQPEATGPAEGAVVSTLTPTLAVSPVYTAAGPEATYEFQLWNNSTASGTPVWDTGGYGASRSAQVPNGYLRDGTTYSWRATSKDGGATSPGFLSTFRVDRRLGDDATQATEKFGPLTVNVGNGNVRFSTATPSISTVAGPASVSFAYNSSAVQVEGGVAPVLPGNWTMAAGDSGLEYINARTEGTSVVVTDASGVLHTYTANANTGGFSPPSGEQGVLTKNDADGSMTLQDEDGRTYRFTSTGILDGVTSSEDDRKPAALAYSYDSAHPSMLTTVADPLRPGLAVLSLTYENGATDINGSCPSLPSGLVAATGMVCQATLVDGRKTNLFYVSAGVGAYWLSRIDQLTTDGSRDSVWDFGYDSQGRLNSARDPLNFDWVAGHSADDANQHWDLTYDQNSEPTYNRVLSITGPRPDPAVAKRPKRSFTYRTGEDQTGFMASGLASGVDVVVGNDGLNEIVVGSGAGATAQVSVYSGSGLTLFNSFQPYGAFAGGVHVAVGEVDAGHAGNEIITGTGAGGGPSVQIWTNAGTKLGNGFFAYDQNFTGGVDVAVGDIIPGGEAEIVTGPGAGGSADTRVYNELGTQQTTAFDAYPSFTGGERVTTTDRDFDDKAEIVTGAGPGGGPHVRVWNGTGTVTYASYFAFDPNFDGGIDVGGDPKSDALAVTTQSQDAVLVTPTDGSYFRLPYPGFTGGASVAMGQLDGFGSAQAITGAGAGGGPHVRMFSPKGVNDVSTDFDNGTRMTRRVEVDGTSRVTREVDAAGGTTRTMWDPAIDRVNATIDAAGRKSTKTYDSHGWITAEVGPDLASCFDGSCLTAPRTTYSYDDPSQNITGLGAAYSSNKTLSGAPVAHATGVGAADPGALNQTWPGLPAAGVPAHGWSARFTGEINLASTGRYTFETLADDGVRVFIDDKRTIDDWADHSSPATSSATYDNSVIGTHRIRVEFYDGDDISPSTLTLKWLQPGEVAPAYPVPGYRLTPAYG
jgi:hypothetical protein